MADNKHWRPHADTLERLIRREPFGLITDIDGTISPIAPTPEAAVVTDEARAALRRLVSRVRLVATVSGRGAADARRLVDVPGVVVVGSHGLERWRDGKVELVAEAKPYLDAVQKALAEAEPLLAQHGMTPEPKGITASLHYRNAPNRDDLRDLVYPQLATIAERHRLELFEGRYVIEIHPPLEIHKGTAVSALASEFALAGAVFLGDDVTDVNAFRSLRDLRQRSSFEGAALGVVSTESPGPVVDEADYTLNGVPDVEAFLRWMLDIVG